jgi:hypothetical protein
MRKTLPEKYAYIHGVKDVEKPVDLNLAIRGNPFRPGDLIPRGFRPCWRRRRADSVSRRAAAGSSCRHDRETADRHSA